MTILDTRRGWFFRSNGLLVRCLASEQVRPKNHLKRSGLFRSIIPIRSFSMFSESRLGPDLSLPNFKGNRALGSLKWRSRYGIFSPQCTPHEWGEKSCLNLRRWPLLRRSSSQHSSRSNTRQRKTRTSSNCASWRRPTYIRTSRTTITSKTKSITRSG